MEKPDEATLVAEETTPFSQDRERSLQEWLTGLKPSFSIVGHELVTEFDEGGCRTHEATPSCVTNAGHTIPSQPSRAPSGDPSDDNPASQLGLPPQGFGGRRVSPICFWVVTAICLIAPVETPEITVPSAAIETATASPADAEPAEPPSTEISLRPEQQNAAGSGPEPADHAPTDNPGLILPELTNVFKTFSRRYMTRPNTEPAKPAQIGRRVTARASVPSTERALSAANRRSVAHDAVSKSTPLAGGRQLPNRLQTHRILQKRLETGHSAGSIDDLAVLHSRLTSLTPPRSR